MMVKLSEKISIGSDQGIVRQTNLQTRKLSKQLFGNVNLINELIDTKKFSRIYIKFCTLWGFLSLKMHNITKSLVFFSKQRRRFFADENPTEGRNTLRIFTYFLLWEQNSISIWVMIECHLNHSVMSSPSFTKPSTRFDRRSRNVSRYLLAKKSYLAQIPSQRLVATSTTSSGTPLNMRLDCRYCQPRTARSREDDRTARSTGGVCFLFLVCVYCVLHVLKNIVW